MQEIFELEDILNALIALEETGNVLYGNLAAKATDLPTRELFTELADQEMHHKHIYESFKGQLTFKHGIQDDYQDYLQQLVKSNIGIGETAVKSYSYQEALNIGIGLEKDTILFLNELKAIITSSIDQIDVLIAEERKHLSILMALKGA